MDHPFHYYLAGERSRAAVNRWQEHARKIRQQANDLADEVGAAAAIMQSSIVGFTFKQQPPEAWTQIGKTDTGKPYFAPSRRTKLGRSLHQRMLQIQRPTAAFFSEMIGCEPLIVEGGGPLGLEIRHPTFEII